MEEDKEDTAVKLDRSMELAGSVVEVELTGMLVLLVFTLLEKVGRRTVEILGLSTDRVGVVRRGGFGGVTSLQIAK